MRRRRPRRRFRWWLLGVPAVVLMFMWLAAGIGGPSLSWHDFVTDTLHVKNSERFTEIATLGVIAVAVVLILRVLRGEKEDSE